MSRNITTITRNVLGPGHVIEDANPTPIRYRKNITHSKPVSETGKQKNVKPPNT